MIDICYFPVTCRDLSSGVAEGYAFERIALILVNSLKECRRPSQDVESIARDIRLGFTSTLERAPWEEPEATYYYPLILP